MHPVSGGCHCGNIEVSAVLSRATHAYDPRACDCDFCEKHGAAYVSDAQGTLEIHIRDEHAVVRYRQGSERAEFLLCARCGVLIGAVYEENDLRYATVNIRCIGRDISFGAPLPASPQRLSAAQKVQRWRDLWFPDVRIDCAPPPGDTR